MGKKLYILVLLLIASLLLAACGARGSGGGQSAGSDKTYELRVSFVVNIESPKGQAAQRFKELVESRSNGRITVTLYPSSTLYGDNNEIQAIQTGAVEMLLPSSSKFSTITNKFQVLDLPFLINSLDELPQVLAPDTKVGKLLYENEDIEAHNMKVLGMFPDGMMQIAANKEIRSPEDLKGMRFRIQPADVIKSIYSAWGAQTVVIALGELYTALQQGIADGHENTYAVIYGSKAHEVQKFIVETDHRVNVGIAVINKPFFDSLPPDLQEVVSKAAQEAGLYCLQISAEQNAEFKKKIIEAGTTQVLELTPEEREAFKRAVVPKVWDEYASVLGQDVIEDLKAKMG
ncbi:MAG: hypothetical protein BAA02_13000 [Paenibacillaceae bacterium ZCTH02-B3]|nr:MAG: hypothetical protein BAA02_13000 [Paenibacillaceae bacterium ZCTH02-B3]